MTEKESLKDLLNQEAATETVVPSRDMETRELLEEEAAAAALDTDNLDELIHSDHLEKHKSEKSNLFVAGLVMMMAIALHNFTRRYGHRRVIRHNSRRSRKSFFPAAALLWRL